MQVPPVLLSPRVCPPRGRMAHSPNFRGNAFAMSAQLDALTPPVFHCESCGTDCAEADISYCVECDRYVCPQCWAASRRRCKSCPNPVGRGVNERAARRADRRLREAIRAAELMRAPNHAEFDEFALSSLSIKVRSAAYAGEVALGKLRTESAGRLRLRRRFASHVETASAAAADLAKAMAVGSYTGAAAPPAAIRRNRPPVAAFLGSGMAAVVTVVAVAGWVAGGLPERGAVLDAAQPAPTDAQPPESSTASGPANSTPASPAVSSTADNFDDVRMASGLGPGWSVEPRAGAIGVAAVPNAVDRSARVEAAQSPARACRALAGTVEEPVVSYDVLVEPGISTAQLILTGLAGDLTIAIGSAGGQIFSSAGPAGDLPIIAADVWYRVRLDLQRADIRIVERESGGSKETTELSTSLPDTRYDRVCISTAGDAGSASYFDNLTIRP